MYYRSVTLPRVSRTQCRLTSMIFDHQSVQTRYGRCHSFNQGIQIWQTQLDPFCRTAQKISTTSLQNRLSQPLTILCAYNSTLKPLPHFSLTYSMNREKSFFLYFLLQNGSYTPLRLT